MIFHPYGLLIGLGVLFVYVYSERNKRFFNLTEKNVDLAFLISLPLALIFARVYHVLSSLNYYLIHPLEVFYIWNGGLGIFGLIFGVLVGLVLSARILKITFEELANLFFPSLLIAQSIGRIGNFFTQEALAENGFPVFLLESILCLTAFLFFLSDKKFKNDGLAFYLVSYGSIRFITEFLRTDTWKIGNLHIAHVFSVFMIIGGTILFRKKYSRRD